MKSNTGTRFSLIRNILTAGILAGLLHNGIAQCDLDFSSTTQFPFTFISSTDIVNGGSSGANSTSTQSFDVIDDATGACTAGGVDDITFEFEIIHAFDQYGVDGIIDTYAGVTHDVIQDGTGLKGRIPLGNSSTNETSAGDVRGYSIRITFADHIVVDAQDLTVNLTSVNTAGTAHESSSIIFLDESGSPYGSATYQGYYAGTTGPSTDGSCTAPPVNTESWTISATGAYTASSTGTVNHSGNACNTDRGSNGPNDNYDVNPYTDTGLNATDRIGGLIFTVYLEDIAASTAPGANTTTSTSFSSTINGLLVGASLLPLEFMDFDGELQDHQAYLSWTTINETENVHFEVQWSKDAQVFQTVGRVMAINQRSKVNKYWFTHSDPAFRENYYRLKQVDIDGKSSYSDVVIINYANGREVVEIFPTMATHTVNLTSHSTDLFDLKLYDMGGTHIRSLRLEPGSRKIDVSDLQPGYYLVYIRNANFSALRRFAKIE